MFEIEVTRPEFLATHKFLYAVHLSDNTDNTLLELYNILDTYI